MKNGSSICWFYISCFPLRDIIIIYSPIDTLGACVRGYSALNFRHTGTIRKMERKVDKWIVQNRLLFSNSTNSINSFSSAAAAAAVAADA